MPYITIRYERKKVYEEVWAEPVRTVAKLTTAQRTGGASRSLAAS